MGHGNRPGRADMGFKELMDTRKKYMLTHNVITCFKADIQSPCCKIDHSPTFHKILKGAVSDFAKSPSLIYLLVSFTVQLIIGGHRSVVC